MPVSRVFDPMHRFALLLAALLITSCSRALASPPSPSRAESGFAVVELFTSEGCSSCPPADAVLRDLSGADLYPLSFHVDYWNELGWVDPFSAVWATERQRTYARALGERGVYTPEMIVNGRDAFVGSDRAHAARSIDKALAKSTSLEVFLRAQPSKGQ